LRRRGEKDRSLGRRASWAKMWSLSSSENMPNRLFSPSATTAPCTVDHDSPGVAAVAVA
jgi:hypothetical protein